MNLETEGACVVFIFDLRDFLIYLSTLRYVYDQGKFFKLISVFTF